MTVTDIRPLPPVPATVDNPEDWTSIAADLAREAGSPPACTVDTLATLVASAVTLLFEADSSRQTDLLRGTFADQVISQCQRNLGCLGGAQPLSVGLRLVGAPAGAAQPTVRLHIQVATALPDGSQSANSQFWDVALGMQAAVAPPDCPNCGAPLTPGQLICSHCRADVRAVVTLPLAVSKLELY